MVIVGVCRLVSWGVYGCVLIGTFCSRLRMVKYLGSILLVIF